MDLYHSDEKQINNENALAWILNKEGYVNTGQKMSAVLKLSLPAILAQISSIVMQYIDAAMVGGLGADASAAIGVVSTSTWLLGGMGSALSMGFAVQTAQKIGAGKDYDARNIFRNSIGAAFLFSTIITIIGIIMSPNLPKWLGADKNIWNNATGYFFIYCCSLPLIQLNSLAGSMLQSSGNMKLPSILNGLMCLLDVIFNYIFIGKLGVIGAAIGTAMAELVICCAMMWAACFRSRLLRFRKKEKYYFDKEIISRAFKIGAPVGLEHIAICGAMVVSTKIIAPLGNIAVSAHSFAITAESLCYMPGYGIGAAATTLVGQSIGANKKKMADSFANLSIILGVALMTFTAVIMYFICPFVFKILTPDLDIQNLAAKVLRIELFAEPLYAVSIVTSGALQGAGDTLVPSIINLLSIWGVRIILSVILVGKYGLPGAWIAMAVELCVRGILLFLRKQTGVLKRI